VTTPSIDFDVRTSIEGAHYPGVPNRCRRCLTPATTYFLKMPATDTGPQAKWVPKLVARLIAPFEAADQFDAM
jgi:hypothetical protein